MNSDDLVLRKKGDGLPLAVLFAGWATDHRIFDDVDLPANKLLPIEPFSFRIQDDLANYIRANGPAQVTLIGWSLGGFVAVEFARRFPELVSTLILCGVRLRYPSEQIEAARQGVLDDKQRFLASFYRQCFLPAQRADYQRFRADLLPRYLEEMNADHLLTSLDLLGKAEMAADSLPVHPTCMIHGAQDIVAPVEEAMAIAESAENVRLHVISNAGHAAFLTPESREIIARCLS